MCQTYSKAKAESNSLIQFVSKHEQCSHFKAVELNHFSQTLAVGGSRPPGSSPGHFQLYLSSVKCSRALRFNTRRLSHISDTERIPLHCHRFPSDLHRATTQEAAREFQTYSLAEKKKKKKRKRSKSDYLVVQTRRRFSLSRALCCWQCWPGSRRECYCTPCNVRVCLAGWMRSAALGVVQVGGYFLEGSGQTIAFISCQCAKQNIQRKAKCAELERFGRGMFRRESPHQQETATRNSFRDLQKIKK